MCIYTYILWALSYQQVKTKLAKLTSFDQAFLFVLFLLHLYWIFKLKLDYGLLDFQPNFQSAFSIFRL